MTCVMRSSQSSTGEAKLYVGRPSLRTRTRSSRTLFGVSISPRTRSSYVVVPSSGIRNLARGVGVLDPQQAPAGLLTSEEPVEEERTCNADVQEARGARSHAYDDGHESVI